MAGPSLRESQRFIEPWLAGRRRILEVGCGDGTLAAWLAGRGHEVTAIDRRPAAGIGPLVSFVEGDFMAAPFPDASFDAVVLVAVLHHLAPLDAAVLRLRGLLADGGVLVVDDFDLAAPDDATAAFWAALQGLDIPAGASALERWQRHHHHDDEPPLHGAKAMQAEIVRSGLRRLMVGRGPYLFRYVDDDAALATERRGILDGTLRAIGFQIVAAR